VYTNLHMKATRREALIAVAALAAPLAPAQTIILTATELAVLTPLVDAIIPRTDTPGASDAGVPAAIDRRLAGSPPAAEQFRAGLRALDAAAETKFGASFGALTVAQRTELLQARLEDPFFRTVKGMTVDAYYTSKEGLAGELGWHGNTYLPEFKGCTHPEHQS
jgi:hypothetical protein